jgi:hypothetical protein
MPTNKIKGPKGANMFQDLRQLRHMIPALFFNQAFDPPVIPSFEERFETTISEIISEGFLMSRI